MVKLMARALLRAPRESLPAKLSWKDWTLTWMRGKESAVLDQVPILGPTWKSTSGFEGPWTVNPIQWDNSYFTTQLVGHNWTNSTGPGGKQQWHSSEKPQGLGAFGGSEEIMMLTSDVALLNDPMCLDIVNEFAGDSVALDEAFAAA